MSVLVETGRDGRLTMAFGWIWKLEYATFTYQPAFEGGKWMEYSEVTWTAEVGGSTYVIEHDDVNGRFEVIERGGRQYRIIGETGSPLEAMRLARLDRRAILARAEDI